MVTQPYTVLTTDVTQINLLGTKLYLAAIIDMYSKEILAYDIRTSPNMAQVTACVDQLQVYLMASNQFCIATREHCINFHVTKTV
ncbi:DDE-type integrase/transposase/recombinase [Periweissella cryptocerci]|uniref:DDE-type integrase/transposase/recombinase n=1 Tax=Periweissella cryptocerci TaxID=2506420 RepID=UPI003C12C725